MKFTCNRSVLAEAVNNVSPAVSSKSALSTLEGILLQCNGSNLSLTGYNLELGITKVINVEAKEEGSIILPARLLADILNKSAEGDISFSTDEKNLTVINGNTSEFTILGIDAKEYPEMPTVAEENKFSLPVGLLRNMISQTIFAVAVSDQVPITTGTLFDISDNRLNMVSVDGCRLAMRKEQVKVDGHFYFVVPGKTLSEIQKLLARLVGEDEEETIEFNVSKKHIIFSVCGYSVVSRLLEGEFLDYKAAIPPEKKTTVKISTREFIKSIDRASIIITDKVKSHIKCAFVENNVNVSCVTTIGKVNDNLTAEMTGEDVTIGFNNKFMTDALKASECDEVLIELNGPLSPMKIVPIEGDSFLFLVLPVRLK